MRLRNLGQRDDYECDNEDYHGDDHHRSSLSHCGLRDGATYEPSYECRSDSTTDRVTSTTELNELITLISATAQRVEHRIHTDVKKTHRETCYECTCYINSERLHITGSELDGYTHETDDNGES